MLKEMFLGRLCGKYACWRQHTHRGPGVLLPDKLHPTPSHPFRTLGAVAAQPTPTLAQSQPQSVSAA